MQDNPTRSNIVDSHSPQSPGISSPPPPTPPPSPSPHLLSAFSLQHLLRETVILMINKCSKCVDSQSHQSPGISSSSETVVLMLNKCSNCVDSHSPHHLGFRPPPPPRPPRLSRPFVLSGSSSPQSLFGDIDLDDKQVWQMRGLPPLS